MFTFLFILFNRFKLTIVSCVLGVLHFLPFLPLFISSICIILTTGLILSKHYTQFTQTHTLAPKRLRSFAKLNTLLKL